MNSLKRMIRNYLLDRWDLLTPTKYGRTYFSQEGEDALLWRIISQKPATTRTYVDVGCNHPFSMSNTAFFYRLGWEGIAIDPNPNVGTLFKEHRPRDLFVNCGVALTPGTLKYYQFTESLYNTFDATKAKNIRDSHSVLTAETYVPVTRLEDILSSSWPNGRDIMLLSIDCEGLDLEVLQSMDFYTFPTKFICVEIQASSVQDAFASETTRFLHDQGFELISKLSNSCIFLLRSELRNYGF